MSIVELVRPEIRALSPYEAAQQVDDTIRLNANEAPWTSSGDRFRRPLNRYPEIRPAALSASLAAYFGCDAAQLLLTRGSSEAIDLLIRAFCREGKDNIVTAAPTFSMYDHYAIVQGAENRVVATDPDDGFRLDVDALLGACDDNSRLIFICSPNNPTGTTVPRERLKELLQRRGRKSAIVVDEAYIEFSSHHSAVELIDTHDNLVVLRTLSKALAFAGARCGAVMGPSDVIRILNAVQPPYALATPVVECVEDAMGKSSLEEAQSHVAEIVAERERVMKAVSDLPCVVRVWPSEANFFLVRVDNSDAVMAACRAGGVLLRDFGGSLGNCIRITIGSREENDALLVTLASISKAAHG
jgi:histidinol-phosphate aminotransferase